MEPVSTAIGCTAYFYITDHLMTPQMLTSISGTTVWYAELSSFGTANVITSTVTNNLRFPGQYADAESGLYYNYHRYYNSEIGRYIQEDPNDFASFVIEIQKMISFQFTQNSLDVIKIIAFQTMQSNVENIKIPSQLIYDNNKNLFLYTLNNPLNYIDITGYQKSNEAQKCFLKCYAINSFACIPGCGLLCSEEDEANFEQCETGCHYLAERYCRWVCHYN